MVTIVFNDGSRVNIGPAEWVLMIEDINSDDYWTDWLLVSEVSSIYCAIG